MPPAPPPAKGRILVVDDDRLVLAILSHGLAEAGFEVLDADDAEEAVQLAQAHRPGLALLDIRLQGSSGLQLAARLRDELQLPCMFLSAFSDADTVERVKAVGAVAYLVKPLDISQIVPGVEIAYARAVTYCTLPDATAPGA